MVPKKGRKVMGFRERQKTAIEVTTRPPLKRSGPILAMRGRQLIAVISVVFVGTQAGNVQVCRDLKSCAACADSYIHVLGFKEQCRWCVETQSCGGPLSCPFGKPVVQRDLFRCPTTHSEAQGKRYSDALGRSLFAVSVSVRDPKPSECLRNVRPDITYTKTYEVECDGAGNKCKGLLGVSDEAKALYVAYKGTSFDKQLFAEFLHGLAAQLGAWEKFESEEAGVITYFHNAFYKLFVESGMKDDLVDLQKKYPSYRVWVTGHSLGGSLASMTALYLVKTGSVDRKKMRLVTFGEPRTGNVAYAKEIESFIDFRYRVIKKNDAVTNLPASADPNTPLLTASMYNRQPLYYRFLVHYDNLMQPGDSFKICELSDDHGCRNLAMAGDFSDHTSYFGINQDDYVREGCPRAQLIR
ncbi:unnamed protein product [Caenorhabditis auriculariae]|uniref:Fungal lipase-type domain-containing protein n=1 Tax=Caenorhabditis auriculariae TaxID=2777116 RepID=A0A8S1HDD4_9PELO|nr:unnamed protein product [Caenorhabditis auriculariae]